jgi:hypothetical protein
MEKLRRKLLNTKGKEKSYLQTKQISHASVIMVQHCSVLAAGTYYSLKKVHILNNQFENMSKSQSS